MRIALCLEYPIDQRGGTEVLVSELVRGLSRQHHVILVSPDTEESLAQSPLRPMISEHVTFTPDWRRAGNARQLAGRIARTKPDIAHFHAGGNYGWGNRFPFRSPAYYVHRAGIPVCWTSHRAESILEGFCGPQKSLVFKLLVLPIAWFGKIQQTLCTRCEITVSQDNLRKMGRWYWPCRSRFVQVYHSRLHLTPEADEKFERQPMILSVGHFAQVKGQKILVEAFAQIAQKYPEYKLLLAGHGGIDGTAECVKKIIGEFGLEKRVELLGQRTDTEVLMRQAAIYVQPSLNEALGLALQEAMYYGCAVIGSQVGGIPELVQPEINGLLSEPGNVKHLASTLIRLINNPAQRTQLGQAAAASVRARGMTAESMVARHLEIYERAAAKV